MSCCRVRWGRSKDDDDGRTRAHTHTQGQRTVRAHRDPCVGRLKHGAVTRGAGQRLSKRLWLCATARARHICDAESSRRDAHKGHADAALCRECVCNVGRGEVGEAGAGEACNEMTSLWDVGGGAKGTQQHARHPRQQARRAQQGGESLSRLFLQGWRFCEIDAK